MADKKISELNEASAINQTDVSVLVSGGADYKFAFSTLLQFLGNNLSVGANISFGTTLPQNTSGKTGDLFINTISGAFAQKLSGTWSVVYTLPVNNTQTDSTVLYGSGIPGSATGNNNDTYINTGTGVFYKKASGTWSQVFSMQTGPQGPQGAAGVSGINGTNGFSILNGTGSPSNLSTGVNGDFYINTSNYTFFGPKTGGIWGDGVSLIPPGLKAGGTTGQVLAKASNDDYDSEWKTLDVSFGALSGVPGDNAALDAVLDSKVDKVAGKSLIADTEITRLAGVSNLFDGTYTSLTDLQTAFPTSLPGHEALVDPGAGTAAIKYIWDSQDGWVKGGGVGASSFADLSGNANDNVSLAAALSSKEPVLTAGTSSQYFKGDKSLGVFLTDVLASVLTGISFSNSSNISAADSILAGIGKLQAQVTAETSARSAADTALTFKYQKLIANSYQSSL